VKELGPAVVADLIRRGAAAVGDLLGEPVALPIPFPVDAAKLLDGAKRVRDLIPDPLPNVAEGIELEKDIADALKKLGRE